MTEQERLLSAYKATMEIVKYLDAQGIETRIGDAAYRAEAKDKGKDGGLPIDKWVTVLFYPKNVVEAGQIQIAQEELLCHGIRFNSKTVAGVRQWDLDWSFGLLTKEAAEEGKKPLGDVDDAVLRFATEKKTIH